MITLKKIFLQLFAALSILLVSGTGCTPSVPTGQGTAELPVNELLLTDAEWEKIDRLVEEFGVPVEFGNFTTAESSVNVESVNIERSPSLETTRTDILKLQLLITRAHLYIVQGETYREPLYEKEREKIDEEVANIGVTLVKNFTEQDKKYLLTLLNTLLKEYDKFKTENSQWYRTEEKRVEVAENILKTSLNISEALYQSHLACTWHAKFSIAEDEHEKHVRLLSLALELQEFRLNFEYLHRRFYMMIMESYHEMQARTAEDLKTGAETLITKLTELRETIIIYPEIKQEVEKAMTAIEDWTSLLKANMELHNEQDKYIKNNQWSLYEMMDLLEKMEKSLPVR